MTLTRPGTAVSAAKRVTMETLLRDHAEFAHAHSPWHPTGVCVCVGVISCLHLLPYGGLGSGGVINIWPVKAP